MRRRLLLSFAALSVLIAMLTVWSQTRTVRVRPGAVRFTLSSPFESGALPGYVLVDDDVPTDEELRISEGDHQLRVMVLRGGFDADPLELTRSLRASGPRADDVQDVTIRVWPWQGRTPLTLLRTKWLEYEARRGLREVTVRLSWPDGGVAAGSYVSCDGRLVEVDATGVASCGESKSAVKVLAWTDWYTAAAIAEVPSGENHLELIVQPKTRPASE